MTKIGNLRCGATWEASRRIGWGLEPRARVGSALKGRAAACLFGLVLLAGPAAVTAAEPESFESLAAEYQREIQPLTKQFCLRCHSAAEKEGELDLERFATLDAVRHSTKTWLKVTEMLDNGEMPPKDAAQPSAEQRKQWRDWIDRFLNAEAYARAGDPGPVVLRRLNNAQYTYTLRDLTGVDLNPAREFPSDSAAGEGFTNTGGALVMSPSLLTKYLDAGKAIAQHAVLLPDGFRFSAATTRRDWTNEILARIRETYRQQTNPQSEASVNLQGIVFNTNEGGRLPLEKYLAATLAERDSLAAGTKTAQAVAGERGLNAKYLAGLWNVLTGNEPSLVLDALRVRWQHAQPGDAASLAADIAQWQNALTKFQSVGHMKPWMVPVNPVTARQEIRFKIPEPANGNEVRLYLAAGDGGDGNTGDFVVWQQPQLVIPGRPNLALRDVREFTRGMIARRQRVFASAANCLAAAAEGASAGEKLDRADLARRHNVDADALAAWLDYLGIGAEAAIRLDYFTNRIPSASNYEFVKGWGSSDTPLLLANSSDQHVRIPGNMKPHGVTVHPSPKLYAAVGWRSPVSGPLRIEATVTHAHPECGNGVTWSLELRRGSTRQRLAAGIAAGNTPAKIGPLEPLAVQRGDLVSLLIGPRDGNHSCDLTDVELALKTEGEGGREWNLTRDVSNDVLAGNPHADRFGNQDIWHFYAEAVQGNQSGPVIPAGSLLAQLAVHDRGAAKAEPCGGGPATARRPAATGEGPSGHGAVQAIVVVDRPAVRGRSLNDGHPYPSAGCRGSDAVGPRPGFVRPPSKRIRD